MSYTPKKLDAFDSRTRFCTELSPFNLTKINLLLLRFIDFYIHLKIANKIKVKDSKNFDIKGIFEILKL